MKESMLRSFKENDNFYETKTRLNEMALLADGVLAGKMGNSHLITFPDKYDVETAILEDPDYSRIYEKESQVVGCVPIYLMASLVNDLKPHPRFKAIIELGQQIGRRANHEEKVTERGICFMLHWKKSTVLGRKWDKEMVTCWKVMNQEHGIFSDVAASSAWTRISPDFLISQLLARMESRVA